jgi:polysaccharide pyruvyl transferase WcaK-like protein
MAKLVMKDLKVTHNKYSDDPKAMLSKMGSAEKILATRYHATIFAFKVGAKVVPMAYAKKNEFLLTELGFKREDFISSADLANGKKITNKYIEVKEDIIDDWENNCYRVLNNCIDRLLVN